MVDLKIGVVAEGVIDYWVIKHVVERFLKDKGAYTVALQPKITTAGKQEGYGGWKKVFEYISQKEYIINLAQIEGCEYVIVQIDTDVCEEYGVEKSQNLNSIFNSASAKIFETVCSRVDNCINTINYEIRSEGAIDKNNKGSGIHLYSYILQKKKKPKELQDISKYNLGFYNFIESLKMIK